MEIHQLLKPEDLLGTAHINYISKVIEMLPTVNEPWISLLIMDALKNIEPSLHLQRGDKKVLQICCTDFRNYSDYLDENGIKVESVMPSSVAVEVDLTTGDYHVEGDEWSKEIVEFVQMWVRGWWKKYMKRVKITVMKTPPFKPSKNKQRGTMMMGKFSEDEISDIKKAIVHTLIKSGEICCTNILADSLFKGILGRYSEKIKWTQEKKLNFMASVIKEAKRMSRTHGPLIFIKPDKKYYELREFRDDNATSLV